MKLINKRVESGDHLFCRNNAYPLFLLDPSVDVAELNHTVLQG